MPPQNDIKTNGNGRQLTEASRAIVLTVDIAIRIRAHPDTERTPHIPFQFNPIPGTIMIIEGLSLIPTSAVKHVSRKKSFVFFYNSVFFYIFLFISLYRIMKKGKVAGAGHGTLTKPNSWATIFK